MLYSGLTLSEAELSAYYADSFAGTRHFMGQQVNAKVNIGVLEKIMPISDLKGRSVLDVGSGYGLFLSALKSIHDDIVVEGLELSAEESRYAVNTLGVCMHSSVSEIPEGKFDLITCFEVIEHTIDPIGFLNGVRPLLKDDGLLLIGTDNFRSKVVSQLGPQFPKWIPHSHISHFSGPTLRAALEACCFEVADEFSYTPWEFYVRRILSNRFGLMPYRYDLKLAQSSEMSGGYRFAKLRRSINSSWMRLTASRDLQGAMMYALCSRATRN